MKPKSKGHTPGHTPGPWTVTDRGNDGAAVYAVASVAWCGTASCVGISGSQFIDADEARANARLIAAAPALLAALEWYVKEDDTLEHLESNRPWLEGRDRARAAILAAKGEPADDEDEDVPEDAAEDAAEDADVIAYTLAGTVGSSAQRVIESRTRVATLDAEFPVWVCREKNAVAARRPLSDWDYDELWLCGNVRDEAVAVRWVVEGKVTP